ncbi:hypothetical protein [Clostridium neonatale]|uniref:Uncharacterized protein n=1 Tax=Clostridium neonatale TaxID=137838 RepID=A0AA86ME92_9CLOT|nr:hypothetical protein [Clostridium neonatale]MBP8312224.1 hypothetical protein [Clostridium neonatale]CAG9704004.1 conserved hypothetical protein [Clostridium neonatale]CAI4139488.1 conserved hypothetical protein [Clostridium neonatale]
MHELYSNFELMLLAVYSNGLESGQSLESLDNMDFLYFIDILIYRKFKEKDDGEYIDNLML